MQLRLTLCTMNLFLSVSLHPAPQLAAWSRQDPARVPLTTLVYCAKAGKDRL
jgi:hypothetical protein